MKKFFLYTLIVFALCAPTLSVEAQERLPIREYTNPEERISISGDTKFWMAMDIFTGMFKRFGGKVLVYDGKDEKPISINIPNMYWRDAFDMVLRINRYWYEEKENYLKVFPLSVAGIDTAALSAEAARNVHDVEISTIYFEVRVSDLKSLGIDWSVVNTAPSGTTSNGTVVNVAAGGTGLNASVATLYKAADITAALKALEEAQFGEVISSPSIIVRSGDMGRIQIGSDVSIKQKDFAGNLVENFFSTGLITEVKPTVMVIDSTNVIALDIMAERSSVLPDPNRTVIDRTKATTSVFLLDNEETVVGGLYTNETKITRRGIPVLKDIPWWFFGLRYLFGYDENSVEKKELIMILKARILPSLKDRIAQKFTQGTTQELQQKLQRNDELFQKIRAQVDPLRKK